MIDMHNHTLFGVDDGPETIEESMELIKEASNKGVTHIIVTPHFNKRYYHLNHDKVPVNFQILKERLMKILRSLIYQEFWHKLLQMYLCK